MPKKFESDEERRAYYKIQNDKKKQKKEVNREVNREVPIQKEDNFDTIIYYKEVWNRRIFSLHIEMYEKDILKEWDYAIFDMTERFRNKGLEYKRLYKNNLECTRMIQIERDLLKARLYEYEVIQEFCSQLK
jgi:hypothetical protein